MSGGDEVMKDSDVLNVFDRGQDLVVSSDRERRPGCLDRGQCFSSRLRAKSVSLSVGIARIVPRYLIDAKPCPCP